MEVDSYYGERVLKQAEWHGAPCPKCGDEKLKFTVVGAYKHWVSFPRHPLGKEVTIKCQSCGHNVQDEATLDKAVPLIDTLKRGTKYPWKWYGQYYVFAIVAIFSALVPLFQHLATNDYLENPAKNDIYLIQDSTNPDEPTYNFWKLYATGDIDMMFLKNAVDYDYIPEELDPDDGFFKSVFYVKRAELKQLQEEGLIKRIIRGYPRESTFNQYLEVEKAD